jgi:hypothetical protein
MFVDGYILLTAESLSGRRSLNGKTSDVRDSKAGPFGGSGCSPTADEHRAGRTTPRHRSGEAWLRPSGAPQGGPKPRRMCGLWGFSRRASLIRCSGKIRTSQAPLYKPNRCAYRFACAREARVGLIRLGCRSSSRSRTDCGLGIVAKLEFCSLSYFSLTLCCVTPDAGWSGGHATLHRAEADRRPEQISRCRSRRLTRHFPTHLPSAGRALKLYPLFNGVMNLGRRFVQGQIGPMNCKEEKESKSSDCIRTFGSAGCEKRLRREGRGHTRPSHLLSNRLRPVFP